VGGGAIGLAIAWDLRREGLRVAVIDRVRPGREASWAGAGIIPPAYESHAKTPYDHLRAVSYRRFPELAEEIQCRFGHDVGYRVCGAIDIDEPEIPLSQRVLVRDLRSAAGIEHQTLSSTELSQLEPELTADQGDRIPSLCQIRNPRFLTGLERLLGDDGVDIIADDPATELRWKANSRSEASGVRLASGESIDAGHTIIAAGAWSGEILKQVAGFDLPIYPVQGQILVLDAGKITLRHILLQGKRYIVPRDDGLVLIGSTEEDVGFNKQVTAGAMTDLRQFAGSLVPSLATKPAIYSWAGLRPANRLGHPVLGQVANIANLWVATGHFRHGVQQSLGTSRLIADWIVGRPSFAKPDDFSGDRPAHEFESPFES
jgi:glycine oxidase